jgi:hypothetical protein
MPGQEVEYEEQALPRRHEGAHDLGELAGWIALPSSEPAYHQALRRSRRIVRHLWYLLVHGKVLRVGQRSYVWPTRRDCRVASPLRQVLYDASYGQEAFTQSL